MNPPLADVSKLFSAKTQSKNDETVLSAELKQSIDSLYKDMVNQYFTTRARKYLTASHRDDFINGVWNSIRQLRKEHITKEMIDEGEDARAVDIASDIIGANILFFLTDFNGEEQAIAETQYHQFIKDNLG